MLKEFSIKNYKSINEEVTFSMEADVDRVSENSSHILQIRDNHILRVGSMYGPNGGGKSNILKAMALLRAIVTRGYIVDSSSGCSCVFSGDSTCEFTSFFVTEKYDIGYKVRFVISPESDEGEGRGTRNRVSFINESIYVYDQDSGKYTEICSRDEKGLVSSEDPALADASHGTYVGQSLSIINFFYTFFYNEKTESSSPLSVIFDLYKEISSFIWLPGDSSRLFSRGPSYLEYVINNKEDLIKMMDAADIHLNDIEIEKDAVRPRIYFIREYPSKEGMSKKAIELGDESTGTQKLFDMLVSFLLHKKRGAIFLGDDINAYLHPKLLAAIIELFNSGKLGRSQLIFNSHDIVNMNNRVFRRDEIWFVYRDEKYQTNIIPLSNITNYKGKQIRNDASYGKQYLEGKYGADPFIEKGFNWDE